MKLRAVLGAGACAGALVGCANTRSRPPAVTTPAAPAAFARAVYPAAGISFQTPTNWVLTTGQFPLVVTVKSGQATVAVWRYPRNRPLPHTHRQLIRATRALLAAVRARDPSFTLGAKRSLHFARRLAIELTGTETTAGLPVRVRSIHVYFAHAEIVLENLAPPSQFAQADRQTFRPLLGSMHIKRPHPPR